MPIYRESSTFETEIAIMRETYDCTSFSVATVYVCLFLIHHNHFTVLWNCVFLFCLPSLVWLAHHLCLSFILPFFTLPQSFSSVQFISVQLNWIHLDCPMFAYLFQLLSVRCLLSLYIYALYLCVCLYV